MMGSMASMMAGVVVASAIRELFQERLGSYVEKYFHKLLNYFSPYIQITFHEFQGDEFGQSKAYTAIERYLSANSINRSKRLKANILKDCKSVLLSMDDYEEVTDEFKGIKITWILGKIIPHHNTHKDEEKRYYKLICNREHRHLITNDYLPHVLEEGKAIELRARQRKLYTNNNSDKWWSMWSHIKFEHPSTFDTLAMDPKKKEDIVNDLMTFKKSKDYYKKIGKSWKRGYLLYGPPGTGKSSMIAAMANFLEYDIYDLELTSVKTNTDLRKLLIHTSSKSIIVIEDIDVLFT